MTALPKPHVVLHPRLSARNAAKYFRLPMAEQARFLREQKYPKEAPQVFRQPYYAIAIWSIREYLERGERALVDIRAKIQRIGNASQRMHVTRVVQLFTDSAHAKRSLKPAVNRKRVAYARNIELRLSPDLIADEDNKMRYIYFNSKAEPVDPETARLTLELAHWILDQEGVEQVDPRQIEFIDLFNGESYVGRKMRKKTLKDLNENTRLIESLWPTLDWGD